MKGNGHVQSETTELLLEIVNLRNDLSDIFLQKGPANSEYIELSMRLELRLKDYCEEQLVTLINHLKDKLYELWMEKGFRHQETIETSQKLDEIMLQYQKLTLNKILS